MYKKTKIITIISIFIIFFSINKVYSALYDMEYPPNSTGFADYTDEEADADAEKENINVPDSSYYVGKSSNNYLKSLYVENAEMEPAFNRQYVDYKIQLQDKNTKKINIIAEAEDENAKIEGAGEVELTDGLNHIMVVVTAENGNVQIYNLNIELPYAQSDLKLEDLQIYGVDKETGKSKKEQLNPSFKSDQYEYNIKVPYNTVLLDIRPKATEGTYISTIGGENLELGENTVIIKVISNEDENQTTTYLIKVEREEEKNINIKLIILILAIIFVLILIIITVLTKKKGKRAK